MQLSQRRTCDDSYHEGWNELHPLTARARVGRWDGDWPDDFDDTVDRVIAGFDEANDPDTKHEQRRPRHRWHEHPDVDGCDDHEPDPIG